MKIRTRLLLLILPTVFAVILSISFLTYYTWYHETISYFSDSLEAIALSCAEIIDADGHEWITTPASDRLHFRRRESECCQLAVCNNADRR